MQFALYDLESDAEELENVAEAYPDDFKRLQRELSRWNRAEPFDVETDDSAAGEQEAMDAETEEQLKALGYL